jgi:hypothetical protein
LRNTALPLLDHVSQVCENRALKTQLHACGSTTQERTGGEGGVKVIVVVAEAQRSGLRRVEDKDERSEQAERAMVYLPHKSVDIDDLTRR